MGLTDSAEKGITDIEKNCLASENEESGITKKDFIAEPTGTVAESPVNCKSNQEKSKKNGDGQKKLAFRGWCVKMGQNFRLFWYFM
ncbi:MAG: hypothetical protein LBG58_12060 [Planctomycetaceae bacterium]|nr:hypothetical protein [Planctomycetaceae bacterium]